MVDKIDAAGIAGTAAQQAGDPLRDPAPDAMKLDGLRHVGGAARVKPASGLHKPQPRPDALPVHPD
jgi:hypothetical protein